MAVSASALLIDRRPVREVPTARNSFPLKPLPKIVYTPDPDLLRL